MQRREWLFCAIYIIALLPVMIMRDFTPMNELRYLSIADEALANGSFFAFTNHGIPYADKPPLYLWWVMLCRVIAGEHVLWLLSFMTLIPACVIFIVMSRWMAPYLDARRRYTAMLMLATCEMFIGAAVVLRMDMLMCMFIILALRSFFVWYRDPERNRRQRWWFPVWVFLGIFSKGPLAFLIPLLGTAVFLLIEGRIKTFFRYWNWYTWTVLLVLCGAWFGCVYADGGYEYLDNLLFKQTMGRAVDAFHHKRPFYYYFISMWYCMAPWSLLMAALPIKGAVRHRFSRNNPTVFMITVAIVTLVMLSCISSKVDIYLLPAIPLFVYASAFFLNDYQRSPLMRWMAGIPAFILALALPGLIIASTYGLLPFPVSVLLYIGAGIISSGGVSAIVTLCRKRDMYPVETSVRCVTYGLLAGVFIGAWGIGDANPTVGYRDMCDKAIELSHSYPQAEIMVKDVKRPENMDVYLQRPFTILPDSVDIPKDRQVILMTKKETGRDIPAVRKEESGKFVVIVTDKTE